MLLTELLYLSYSVSIEDRKTDFCLELDPSTDCITINRKILKKAIISLLDYKDFMLINGDVIHTRLMLSLEQI